MDLQGIITSWNVESFSLYYKSCSFNKSNTCFAEEIERDFLSSVFFGAYAVTNYIDMHEILPKDETL